MRRQYDPPADDGVPNPLGPRTHNWKGGPYNEGSLYHGPVYARPGYLLPWVPRPLNGGVGEAEVPDGPSMLSTVLPLLMVGSLVAVLFWPTDRRR